MDEEIQVELDHEDIKIKKQKLSQQKVALEEIERN